MPDAEEGETDPVPPIRLELIADPDAMASAAIQYLEGAIPGWEARPGNVETVLLSANAQIGAEIVEQAAEIDPLIFAYLGEDLLGIPARTATEATASAAVTWAADVDDRDALPGRLARRRARRRRATRSRSKRTPT